MAAEHTWHHKDVSTTNNIYIYHQLGTKFKFMHCCAWSFINILQFFSPTFCWWKLGKEYLLKMWGEIWWIMITWLTLTDTKQPFFCLQDAVDVKWTNNTCGGSFQLGNYSSHILNILMALKQLARLIPWCAWCVYFVSFFRSFDTNVWQTRKAREGKCFRWNK